MKHLWQTTVRTMLWGVLLSTGLSGCWSACDSSNLRAPDAFEPNDTPQTATPLETSRDGSFNTEENDTFKFTASAGETITITVQTLEAGAQPARYALCLSSVKQVFDDKFRCDNRAYPEGSTLSFSAPRDDTYYIDIVEPSPGCRHICGCPTRGSTYRVQLQRAPKVTSVLPGSPPKRALKATKDDSSRT